MSRPFGSYGGNVRVAAAFAFLSALATAREAPAFCRTSVCESGASGTRCTPEREGDCGVPLVWKERCVGFSVQSDGSRYFSAEQAAELVSRAFQAWLGADCEAGRPQFFIQRQPDAVCAEPEFNVDFNSNKGNANVVLFRDDAWPYPGFEHGLALTTISYDVNTGEVYDADIEINTHLVDFSTSDTDVTYDLLTTLVHETGHFLGLDHSPEADAVMFEMPAFATLARRELGPDDVSAVCDAYPPEEPVLDASCSPMPHDFSPFCNHTLPSETSAAEGEGCSMPRAPARGGAGAMLVAAGGSIAALLRRRRKAPAIVPRH